MGVFALLSYQVRSWVKVKKALFLNGLCLKLEACGSVSMEQVLTQI